MYEPRWANVEADPAFCPGTFFHASVCNGGDGSDPYPLYRQGSRRRRQWEEVTTVTGARTNNSTVWILGVLASIHCEWSEDGMAPQNRLDAAPRHFERSKPRCGGYATREGDVHSQVLSSSPGVTSPRARSVADLPECLHNGFHANSSNRQRTHSGLSSPFGIQPRKHGSA